VCSSDLAGGKKQRFKGEKSPCALLFTYIQIFKQAEGSVSRRKCGYNK